MLLSNSPPLLVSSPTLPITYYASIVANSNTNKTSSSNTELLLCKFLSNLNPIINLLISLLTSATLQKQLIP